MISQVSRHLILNEIVKRAGDVSESDVEQWLDNDGGNQVIKFYAKRR
jgi:hypothetical protein